MEKEKAKCMEKIFQHLFLHIPLHKLSFVTTIPKQLLYYEDFIHVIPKSMLEIPTVILLDKAKEVEKLNKLHIANQLIQDPNVIGIIVEESIFSPINEELFLFYEQCQLPIVKGVEVTSLCKIAEYADPCLYINMSKELLGMMEKGFTEVCSELAKGLHTAFLYLNEHEESIWFTGNEEIIREAQRWLNKNKRRLKVEKCHSLELQMDDDFLLYPIHIAGMIEQSLIVSNSLSPWQKKLIDKLVGLTALLLQTEGMFREHELKMMEHFIYDLLYHKFDSHKVMVKQGKTWGWNLEIPHHLILINIQLTDESHIVEDWMEKMVQYIYEIGEMLKEKVIVFPFQDQIVLLLEDGKDTTKKERYEHVMQFAQSMKYELSQKWQKEEIIMGIGKWYKNTIYLNKSYQEAKQAIGFGRIWFDDREIFHIDDLGILRILVHVHPEIINDYCEEYLAALVESDEELGTDYLNTIRVYIHYQRRINEVSDALYVHPNTLRYRLKKIEELTGVDLQDLEQSMNLIIALKLHSLHKL